MPQPESPDVCLLKWWGRGGMEWYNHQYHIAFLEHRSLLTLTRSCSILLGDAESPVQVSTGLPKLWRPQSEPTSSFAIAKWIAIKLFLQHEKSCRGSCSAPRIPRSLLQLLVNVSMPLHPSKAAQYWGLCGSFSPSCNKLQWCSKSGRIWELLG